MLGKKQSLSPLDVTIKSKRAHSKMQYFKRKTKLSILTFLIIVLSITISISTLAKTEVYFSFYDNPQILSTTSPKPEVHTVNINTVSQDIFIKILYVSEPLAQKIIAI